MAILLRHDLEKVNSLAIVGGVDACLAVYTLAAFFQPFQANTRPLCAVTFDTEVLEVKVQWRMVYLLEIFTLHNLVTYDPLETN